MDERPADTTIRTTCPYCGVGCGVLATPRPGGSVAIAGDPAHPANFGRLCSKGSALGETLGLEERLLFPTIAGAGANWDDALSRVAERFTATIAEHGRNSVAFYVSGQLLTEDYYLANKLMKGFIGSANIDTNSRLCMASSVAGHRRAFGSDTVPGTYEDLEQADLIVLVGSNLAWCHPVLYQRIAAAKATRPQMKVVLVDPRRTASADLADLHLPIAADGDTALFAGLLPFLAEAGAIHCDYVARHTDGFVEALRRARGMRLPHVAEATGLDSRQIQAFYELFARTEKVVTVYSQGVNQSVTGTDKVNAIINCHLATGRVGRPGMGPFSVTGQPNAMGGREVGGMANMLAAHMAIEDPAHRSLVRDFWDAPAMPDRAGLKAVDMFRAVADGRIRALWIIGTNPVVSMPDADSVKTALAACPFVVVSDVVARNDTLPFADVALPAAAWGEKDGTVTNSERRISRQRPFLPLPGEVRPDWAIIADVARRMGFADGFSHASAADVFDEHARLSAHGNAGERDFDIGALAGLDQCGYDALQPVHWPQPRVVSPSDSGDAAAEAGAASAKDGSRFFGDGHFYHPDGRARFVAVEVGPRRRSGKGRFLLNTGRVRDHWHTMTRTGRSARLSAHVAEPFVDIHPADAAAQGIAEASLVTVRSGFGAAIVRCRTTDRQSRGSIFVPMHWSDEFSGSGRIDAVVAPAVDPVSGQPGLKATEVSIAPFPAAWFGFAVTQSRPDPQGLDYFALARAEAGWRMELAGLAPLADPSALATALLKAPDRAQMLAFHDTTTGAHRFAAFDGEALIGALWIARDPVAVSRVWAAGQLGDAHNAVRDRFRLLAGRGGADRPDPGAIVCSCFSVGVNEIATAVTTGRAITVEAVGAALKAGTNCGSCRSEIKGIIDDARLANTA